MKTIYKKNPKKILGYLMAFAMVLFSVNAFSCDHTLNMYDSYGDGWNGASVDVTVNGATVVAGASCVGASTSATFSAGSGDAVDLANWVSGSYNSEISWDITDGDGTVIASGAYGAAAGATGYCTPPPSCDHTLNMYDSYGDGWNGASVDVTVNGASVVAAASCVGASTSATFSAASGDAIDLANWVSGSYNSEISWDITDGGGTVIASGAYGGSGASSGNCPVGTPGCMDSTAVNYNAAATVDDGSCVYCSANYVTLDMTDSYGDGWNGNTWTATSVSGGQSFGPYTIATGSVGSESFCMDSDCYDIVCGGGSFMGEVSWTLTDASGVVIASGGAPHAALTSVGGVVCPVLGCMDPTALNYNPLATQDDGSCIAPPAGCTAGIGANSESFEDPAVPLYGQGPWANWEYDVVNSTFTGTNGWRKDNLGTGSSGTGPTNGAASIDGAYYLYCETSGQYGKIAILNSSCVDLSNFSDPTYVAGYNMEGATMGTLNINVSTDGGGTWTTEWTLSGNQGAGWNEAVVSLSAYAGQIVQVQMHYTSGTSFSGDCAIDFLRFMEAPAAGCMDPLAANYDPAATIDDGSCQYTGCPDPSATNYDASANVGCCGDWAAGTWMNGCPNGACGGNAYVLGEANDGSWSMDTMWWDSSPSTTVDPVTGYVTITSVYIGNMTSCEYTGVATSTNVSTHDPLNGYVIVGTVSFTVTGTGGFSYSSLGTFTGVDAAGNLLGTLASSAGSGTSTACCTYPQSNATPFCEDVESGSSATNGWVLAQQPYASAMAWGNGATFVVNGHPGANGPIAGNYSMKFEGGDAPTGWGAYTTEAQAYANVTHVSSASILVDFTGAAASCEMSFSLDLFSGFSNVGYSNMRVSVGGVVLADVNGATSQRSNQAPWTGACPSGTVTYNMSAYSGSTVSVMFEFAGKYSTNYSSGLYGNVALVDDICFYDLSPCTYYAGAASSTDVTCNGGSDGSATASASNGSGSDTYLWDDGSTTASISGLAAGTYCCVVTDATYGCSDTVCATVSEPAAISLSAAVVNESAPGALDGQVNLSISGGTPCITAVTLPVSLAGGNGQSGTAFNVINTSAGSLTVTGFSQGPGTGNSSNPGVLCEVYENGGGSYLQAGNAFALHSSATVALTSGAATGYVPCNIVIPAGGTVGVWIGIAVGTVQYTNGTGTPGVSAWASDANITLTEGHGGTYPLGLNFNPRNFNGAIHYGDPSASAYTFAWDNGASSQSLSGVGAGTYSVTATDCAGCSATASYTVIMSATPGCMDSTASNYNANATIDDGSCLYPGCTDPLAANYDPTANVDDGSCNYCFDNDVTITVGGGSWDSEIGWSLVDGSGVTVASGGAPYSGTACLADDCYTMNMTDAYGDGWNGGTYSIDDNNTGTNYGTGGLLTGAAGSDLISIGAACAVYGCTDPLATNYDPLADTDDGSCIYSCASQGLDDITINLYDSWGDGWNGNTLTVDGIDYTIAGFASSESFAVCADLSTCINATYNNTGSYASENSWDITDASGAVLISGGNIGSGGDFGTCIPCVEGCMDATMFNYDPLATCDSTGGAGCIAFVYGCTDPLALNYYAGANADDGTCVYGCGSITGVNMSDVIHDRATFNWDDMNGGANSCVVDQIRIQYRAVGSSVWVLKTMGAPVGNNAPCLNTFKRVLNLTASTQYEYAFKIWYQDGTVVGFDNNGTFTTADACVNATNVTATPVNSVKTDFCWTNPASHAFVRLQYRENVPGSSFSNIGGFGVMAPANCKLKSGLTPGTQYRVMYRTWCSATGGPYRSPVWDGPVIWDQPSVIRLEGGTTINNLDVYPNPSRNIFNVTFTSEDVQDLDVRVLNIVGEVVYTENLEQFVGEYTKAIDLVTYTKGIYFLEITTNNGVVNKKLILQ